MKKILSQPQKHSIKFVYILFSKNECLLMSIIINGYKVVSIPFIVHYWDCRAYLIDVTIKSFHLLIFFGVRSPTIYGYIGY